MRGAVALPGTPPPQRPSVAIIYCNPLVVRVHFPVPTIGVLNGFKIFIIHGHCTSVPEIAPKNHQRGLGRKG